MRERAVYRRTADRGVIVAGALGHDDRWPRRATVAGDTANEQLGFER